MPPKANLKWTPKTPKKAGWYWFRSEDKTVILNVFDPWKNGVLKAWDFDSVRFQLCAIADYNGEWQGPIYPPR